MQEEVHLPEDDYNAVLLSDVPAIPTSAAYSNIDLEADHGEKLATLLETNYATLRRSIMDFYRDFKASSLQNQRHALEAERRSSAARIATKNAQLDSKSIELTSEQDKLRRLQASLFKNWISAVSWTKHERQLLKKADNWYNVEVLQRRVLKGWWFNAGVTMKMHARKQILAVKGLERTISERERDIEVLQERLLDAQKCFSAEKQAREMLAQDMKRSFMRGVCALNLEAMQVMKRGGINGDVALESSVLSPSDAEQDSESDAKPPLPREEIPENIQNMMNSLNMTVGSTSSHITPTMRTGSAIIGRAIKERH